MCQPKAILKRFVVNGCLLLRLVSSETFFHFKHEFRLKCIGSTASITHGIGWFGSLVVRVLDLRLDGRGISSRPP